jgi:hypothetical protein
MWYFFCFSLSSCCLDLYLLLIFSFTSSVLSIRFLIAYSVSSDCCSPRFLVGQCRSSLFFCVFLLCVFTFLVLCCDVLDDFRIKTMFVWSLPPVVCNKGSCLIYVICVCLRIVVSNT